MSRRPLTFHLWFGVSLCAMVGIATFFQNLRLVGDPAIASHLPPGALLSAYAMGLFGLGLLVFAIGYGIWALLHLQPPLDRLVRRARAAAAGDLSPASLGPAQPELGAIATAIESLAASQQHAFDDRTRDRESHLLAFRAMTAALGDAAALNEDFRALNEKLESEVAERTAELRDRQAFIESMIAHMPVAVAYLDRDLVYRWNNPAHSRLLGKRDDAIIGRPALEVMSTFSEQTLPMYRQALDSREPVTYEGLPFLLPSGAQTYRDVSYVPIADAEGVVQGVLLLSVDVTERVEKQQQKDQFLSVLSHELRTPLNAIMGFAGILDDPATGALSDVQRGFVKKVLSGSETLLSLVEDLLDMSRIQAGMFVLRPGPTALRPIIEDVSAHLTVLADKKRVTLHHDVPPRLGLLLADSQRVRQVLVNLVGNAIKFTPEGGSVTLEVTCEEGFARFEVRDTGIGIAAVDLPKLFQRFGQLDMSATRSRGGTGLGLAISKGLVEAMGGRIGVESTPGVGSTFWFTLPLMG
jgi:PAS domain S-box-containing protein